MRALYARSPPVLQRLARRVAPVLLRRPLASTQSLESRRAELDVGLAATVVAGDSTAAMMPLLDLFTPLRNRGVNGETVGQVHGRLASLLEPRPARLLLLAGANDLLRGRGADATAAALESMLRDAVDAGERTGTDIVALSVLPMRSTMQRRIPSPGVIAAVNDRVRAVAAELSCDYLDLHPPLVDADGELRAELTTDGVHLTMAGYVAVAPLLAPYAT